MVVKKQSLIAGMNTANKKTYQEFLGDPFVIKYFQKRSLYVIP